MRVVVNVDPESHPELHRELEGFGKGRAERIRLLATSELRRGSQSSDPAPAPAPGRQAPEGPKVQPSPAGTDSASAAAGDNSQPESPSETGDEHSETRGRLLSGIANQF